MRRIAVVVTARPSYSRIKSALEAIKTHPQLDLQIVAGSSATLERYGKTVDVMRKDGFNIAAEISNVVEGENLVTMPKTTGLALMELATVFNNIKPDAVVTIADRYETIATSIAASFMNIPVVHIQGGEVTGSIDEKVRHANTKLSDLHLVSSQAAADNVIRMGEKPASVIVTGCPSIDIAREAKRTAQVDFDLHKKYTGVGKHINIEDDFLVVLQHPVTTEHSQSFRDATISLEAVSATQLPAIWFWPNVDAGSDGTSKAIRSFRETGNDTKFQFFKNLHPSDFLRILLKSRCIVGNSSVAIRECSYLGVPAVNIGSRQHNRLRGANVIDVDHDREGIRNAILKQVRHGPYPSETLYGDGWSGKRIADALHSWTPTFTKSLNY